VIRAQLVAALDDWAVATEDAARRAWLLEVARGADPGAWGDRLRDSAMWGKRAALEQLARAANVAELSPQLLATLGFVLTASGADPVPLLTAAQERHPADFWLNFHLGYALVKAKREEEAVGYYRVALALRPGTGAIHTNLGLALMDKGRLDDAIRQYRRAIELDPTWAAAHTNLGLALQRKGRLDDAIGEYRRALALNPKAAAAHYNLGLTLFEQRRFPEAEAVYRKAIELRPGHAQSYCNLGNALSELGRLPEAVAAFRKAIELQPDDGLAPYNLGLALFKQGRLPEAVAAFRKAIELRPDLAEAHLNLGHALLGQGRLAEAEAAFRKAIELRPGFAEAHCNLGITLRQQGHFREALPFLQRGHVLGTKNPRWRYPSADWVRHCRRLADLDARLPAFLGGQERPQDAEERLALLEVCRHKRLYAAAARFYAEAFAEQPRLAQGLREGHRYNAACAAALAAAGKGEDAANLDDRECARLRRQAQDWLRADLAAWTQVLDKGLPQAHPAVPRALRHWQRDPDLAGLRDPDALAQLPEVEREACRKLWADVDALLKRTQPTAKPAPQGKAPGQPKR
jgi:tetratricopeptide (TPR) repeat protein